LRKAEEVPDSENSITLLGLVVRAMAFGYLVPPSPEDLGGFTGHSQ
jgi:hypothetical protein